MAAAIVIRCHITQDRSFSSLSWWIATIAWFIQCFLAMSLVMAKGGAVFMDLGRSLFAIATVLGGFYLVGWRINRREARSVGLLLLPSVVILLLLSRLFPSVDGEMATMGNPVFIIHLVFSLAAYGLFSIAAVLALLDAWQERALKAKSFGPMQRMLPSLGQLEQDLFSILAAGFIFLTLSIVTGMVFTFREMDQLVLINHKVVFTWITWGLFGALLWGHRYYGWRGKRAVQLTLWGYLFLVMAYVGVKFVSEVILQAG
uniref:Putative Cytochrome c assembly protein n=1 Tax=Magnetococcus massalia (strain MO-1) TaxID=451514 RepID=A0A1S7LI29_MAGMO|nr:putative Cytochrome c assembly protein [Candidatus Magnetococcus massalia]